MPDKTFSSNKKHLIFLGSELLLVSLLIFVFVNLKIVSVEEISHYNIIASLLLLLSLLTLLTGVKKRSFVFTDTKVSFLNKKLKFEISYDRIYLVRLFHPENNKQVTLGIVSEPEKEVFNISTAFFDPQVLFEVTKELKIIAEKYEFLIEDEVGWLEIKKEIKENITPDEN